MNIKAIRRSDWNNGDLSLSPAPSKRLRVAHRARVALPLAELFSRLDPARQPPWLARPRAIVTDAAATDELNGVIWAETETGSSLLRSTGLETHWHPVVYDPERHRYECLLLCPKLTAGRLTIDMAATDGAPSIQLELVYTALSTAGNELFDQGLAERLARMLEGIAGALASDDGPPAPPPEQAQTTPAGERVRFEARTATIGLQATVKGDPDQCFSLACPVAELDWIDGWYFDLIYSDSGRNEDDNIFLEELTNLTVMRALGTSTHWYTVSLDAERRRFFALQLVEDFIVGRWEYTVEPLGDGTCRLTIRLGYTGLTERGNEIIAESGFEDRMLAAVKFVGKSAKQYVETGRVYRQPVALQLDVATSLIGASIGRHWRRFHSARP